MKGSHFVLVHGACHGAWCWYKLATLLEQAGHQVSTPELAASGVDSKQADDLKSISEYAQPLMDLMASLPSEEKVILVGHSFGGVVITLAMERFPEKISIAIFLAAFMCGPDLSLVPFVHEYYRGLDSPMVLDMTKLFFSNGTENPPTSMIFGMEFLATMMYQLCPPEVLTLAFTLVRPFFLLSDDTISADVVISKEKYGSVRRVCIVSEEDKSFTKERLVQYMMKNNPTTEVKRSKVQITWLCSLNQRNYLLFSRRLPSRRIHRYDIAFSPRISPGTICLNHILKPYKKAIRQL